ncbi:MAG TPA: ATP-binding cassette domain-containing protein [Frankiaceae bacterium]|nr:ATP-binding cassette domain-containing protein [Frankiaceae bacterium]
MTADAAVSVTGLTKRYGDFEAVRGIDLTIEAGETFGFLGPNGAGKSTTISVLCTLATPTSGSAEVAGFDVVRRRDDVRRNIGLVFPDPTVDGYLTAERNLRRDAAWSGDRARPDALAARALPRRADRGPGPADPQLHLELHPRVEAGGGHHDLPDHALHGRSRVLRPHRDHGPGSDHRARHPGTLKASVGEDRVQIRADDDVAAIQPLADRFGVTATMAEGAVTFPVEQGEAFVPQLFAELPVPIRAVSVSRPTLDDVFMSYTGTTIRDAETTSAQRGREHMQMFRAGARGGR